MSLASEINEMFSGSTEDQIARNTHPVNKKLHDMGFGTHPEHVNDEDIGVHYANGRRGEAIVDHKNKTLFTNGLHRGETNKLDAVAHRHGFTTEHA